MGIETGNHGIIRRIPNRPITDPADLEVAVALAHKVLELSKGASPGKFLTYAVPLARAVLLLLGER